MKPFVLYTLARVLLFAGAFGLVWLVFGRWLEWGAVSALYTAIIAMVISSVVALFALGSLRDDFAVQVSDRADRAKAAYEARRAAEDVDVDVVEVGPVDVGAVDVGQVDVGPVDVEQVNVQQGEIETDDARDPRPDGR